MQTKQMLMLTLQLLGVSLGPEAQAFYNSRTGRWLKPRFNGRTGRVTTQVLFAGSGKKGRPLRARLRYSSTGRPCLRRVEM